MSQSKARWWIIGIWLAGLLVNLVLVMIADFHFLGGVEGEDRAGIKALYVDLLEWYAVPLTAMLAAVFAPKAGRSTKSSSASRTSVPAGVFTLALAISLIWSVCVIVQVVRISPFVEDVLTVQDLTEWTREWVKSYGWLVAPILGYFFAVTGDR